NTHPLAKAGVMMRENLTSGSTHAFMALSAQMGAQFEARDSTGGPTATATIPGIGAPYWVYLERIGNTFNGWVTSDFSDWQLVGSQIIDMATDMYVGVAVTSHDNAVLNTSLFDYAEQFAGGGGSPGLPGRTPSGRGRPREAVPLRLLNGSTEETARSSV